MLDILERWWPFGAFLITGLGGWIMGVERNRWKINDLGASVALMSARIKVLEDQGHVEGVALAKIGVTLEHQNGALSDIKDGLRDIQSDLKRKADKA